MIAIYKDTNTINARGLIIAINELEELAEKYPNHLMFEKTDTLDTELLQNPTKNSERLKKSSNYIESFGLAVLGHSRLGSSVVGTDEEDKQFGEILKIIFGEKKRNEYNKNEIRDGMHVMTTMRYGGNYFITNDRKLLDKSKELFQLNNVTIVCSPEACLARVKDRLKVLGVL